jgi:ribonuclease HI
VCKQWHGEAAHAYHEQLMKAKPLKAGVIPEGSVRNIPTASQSTEVLSASRENGTVAPAQTKENYVAWFDGACEPVNPGGTASFGVVIKDNAGKVLLKDHGIVGKGKDMSNNVAEYAGARRILKYLSTRPPGKAVIRGDAQLIVNQLEGRWRIKRGMYVPIAMETKGLLAALRGLGWEINFCWIPREQNEECDALSKKRCHAFGTHG